MNRSKLARSTIHAFALILLRCIKGLFWLIFFKKTIYIKSWFGELGNNLIQLVHAEFLSEKTNSSLYVPKHPLLQLESNYRFHRFTSDAPLDWGCFTSTLFLADLKNQVKPSINISTALFRNLFYRYDFFPFNPALTDYRRIFKTKIFPLIPYRLDPSIHDETLVIHIRSGDAFKEKGVHSAYVQPPLSFYIKVIETYGYKDIVIVSQADLRNPCIEQLKHRIPTIKIQTSSLEEDVSTILSARNLVVAFSTFSLSLAFSSPNIKQLHIPCFDVEKGYWRTYFWSDFFRLNLKANRKKMNDSALDFKVDFLGIHNYVLIGGWKNSEEQRRLMIEHPLDQVY
ncbi:MAG TPA: hypothetical protein V6C78_02770 [Crinalium sp.]|jgi:hypothetical protein